MRTFKVLAKQNDFCSSNELDAGKVVAEIKSELDHIQVVDAIRCHKFQVVEEGAKKDTSKDSGKK